MDRVRQRPFHDNDDSVMECGPESIDVSVSVRDTWTGLYDEHGVPLHREKPKFGFVVRD